MTDDLRERIQEKMLPYFGDSLGLDSVLLRHGGFKMSVFVDAVTAVAEEAVREQDYSRDTLNGLHAEERDRLTLRLQESEARCEAIRKEAATVMEYLARDGASVVPHLMDDDENPGQRLREALALPAPDALREVRAAVWREAADMMRKEARKARITNEAVQGKSGIAVSLQQAETLDVVVMILEKGEADVRERAASLDGGST